MNLLERYLQAIGQYLPTGTRQDTLAELRSNLLAEMDARVEELDRPLTEVEIVAIIQAHGRPEVVAARYLPQRYLIGPAVFPFYLMTLRRGAPLVVLAFFVVRAMDLFFAESASAVAATIVQSVFQLIPTLLIFWGCVTIVFAILEFAQDQFMTGASWKAWKPESLPALKHPDQAKEKSWVGRVIDLVVHCFWMLYVIEIPYHPFLILGPGEGYLSKLSAAFAPVWHTFYLAIIVLLSVQLGTKLLAVAGLADGWKTPLELLIKLLGVATMGILAFAKIYFVPVSSTANLHTLAAVNRGLNIGFRIALLFVVLDLLVTAWKYVRPSAPPATQQVS